MQCLLIIDPQNDFCHPDGSLFVPGSPDDLARLAAWFETNSATFQKLVVTLDSHQSWDISHSLFWRNPHGQMPSPFSQIRPEQVREGTWRPVHEAMTESVLAYLEALDSGGRYQHTIWPEHCIVGSWGHNLADPIPILCRQFEAHHLKPVSYHFKGLNPMTEHYSAVKAEVPQKQDMHTGVNQSLIAALTDPDLDTVYVAGQALSHCVAATVEDLVSEAPSLADKLVLLRNATSPVPGFEDLAAQRCEVMRQKGVRFTEI